MSSRDYPNLNGIVRRMVSLPRNILGGFSRAMRHEFDRRNQLFPSTPPSLLPPPQFPLASPRFEPDSAMMIDEWAFLNNFEQNFGEKHPFFYACRFIQALKIAEDEKKLLFVYLHSTDHPFTAEFCRRTLCSEIVVEFLDANFVSWGGVSDRGEGLQMCTSLRPVSFPFCAVIAPASADSIAVLQQIEGPVSPAESVEILQRTMEEQGLAFGSSRAKHEENTRSDRRLREEQDAAYLAALTLDQEKERLRSTPREQAAQKVKASSASDDTGLSEGPRKNNFLLNKPRTVKESSTSNAENNQVITQILIRFPNGERRECSFSTADKVQAIYKYIDSLNLPGIGSYRLISSFPRKVYGADQMCMTLNDAGFHPRATLFLELC